jgi:LmbE family N-acetylglucosaminyl deacetylase
VTPLIVMAPHPDDELLGAGGLMASAVADARPVAVIVITDGGASDPSVARDQQQLRRRAETTAGLAELLGGAPPLLFLNYPDGSFVARDVPIGPESTIATFLASFPGAKLLVTDPADGHPDHKAAFGLASRLIAQGLVDQLDIMPISQRIDGPFAAQGYTNHALGHYAEAKVAALACHHSQIDTQSGFALSTIVLADFTAVEYTRPVHNRHCAESEAVPRSHFDAMFQKSSDPWGYDSVAYEADRFRRTIAALDGKHFESALELGCANGALTAQLINCCTTLVATDTAQAALDAARKRLSGRNGVDFRLGKLPDDLPEGRYDLIVLSDMLYYLGLQGVVRLMALLQTRAKPVCRIVMTNYLGETDCALSGEMAAEIALAHASGWAIVHASRTEQLRIDVLERI